MNTSSGKPLTVLFQKGKEMLVLDNFMFKLNILTIKVKYYRFDDRYCGATLHTNKDNVVIKVNGDHGHPPESEKLKFEHSSRFWRSV